MEDDCSGNFTFSLSFDLRLLVLRLSTLQNRSVHVNQPCLPTIVKFTRRELHDTLILRVFMFFLRASSNYYIR